MVIADIDPFQDCYFRADYVDLYISEKKTRFTFSYTEGDSRFFTQAIKTPITEIDGHIVSDELYDLESAYGYGGYVSNTNDPKFLARAMDAYREHCLAEKIVAEFIRAHPLVNTNLHVQAHMDMIERNRYVVVVDLLHDKEVRWLGYTKTTRNILRKTARSLESSDRITAPQFGQLYRQTMDRNRASDFYYFSDEYFRNCFLISACEPIAVFNDGRLISAGLFFFSGDTAHYHLSGNTPEGLTLNANYHLLEVFFEKAKSRGCKYALLGGGRTTAENDSLLVFKKKFSSLAVPFYVMGKIFNPQAYEYLRGIREQHGDNAHTTRFLMYR